MAEMAGYLKAGKMKRNEDVVPGLKNIPEVLLKLFIGENFWQAGVGSGKAVKMAARGGGMQCYRFVKFKEGCWRNCKGLIPTRRLNSRQKWAWSV